MLIFSKIFDAALKTSRPKKRIIQIVFDSVVIFFALCLAMIARLENFSFISSKDFYLAFVITLLPSIYVFTRFGLYRAFLRHVSTDVAVIIAIGSAVSSCVLVCTNVILGFKFPMTVCITYPTFLFIIVSGTRFTLRSLFRSKFGKKHKNIAIYGAGAAGAQTFQSLKTNPNYRVCLVIDDNVSIQGETLFGQRICSFDDAASKFQSFDISTVLLAVPSAKQWERQQIISKLVDMGLEVKTIPSLESLIDGTAKITELKNVAIEELLGREPVEPEAKLMNSAIKGKVVLITGAGGSIGSELCRQAIHWQPKRLIMVDQSEYAIYRINQEMIEETKNYDIQLTPIVTSVLEKSTILNILESLAVDTIYHAAAYKHVPLMEQNVIQGVKNNVFGTQILAECAVAARVKYFTLISTDKAVNPTNFMGASKRLCEILCQSFNASQSATCFSIVRFGNVLGSSGSVIPLFKRQIQHGGPICVTHKDITRFFMTIPEAAQLVIQASALSRGGEVFILDMGKAVPILDLAKKMAKLAGLVPYVEGFDEEGNIPIRLTGLRTGEKLHEELSYEKLSTTQHHQILRSMEKPISLSKANVLFDKIQAAINENNIEACHQAMATEIPCFFSDASLPHRF